MLRGILSNLQKKGIPILVIRDNLTGKPSITYTFFVISGIIVTLGLVGKFVKLAEGIDISNALNFFYGCGAMYVGRKFSKNDIEVEKE